MTVCHEATSGSFQVCTSTALPACRKPESAFQFPYIMLLVVLVVPWLPLSMELPSASPLLGSMQALLSVLCRKRGKSLMLPLLRAQLPRAREAKSSIKQLIDFVCLSTNVSLLSRNNLISFECYILNMNQKTNLYFSIPWL